MRRSLAQAIRERGLHCEAKASRGKLIDGLFGDYVEPTLIQPTFIMDYPVDISPLAKKKADDPTTVERFEYFVAGMELGNAFTELNDPVDQRARFVELRAVMAGDDENVHPLDEDFLERAELRHAAHGRFRHRDRSPDHALYRSPVYPGSHSVPAPALSG